MCFRDSRGPFLRYSFTQGKKSPTNSSREKDQMTYKETRKDWTPDDDGERNRNLAYCVQLKHPLHVRTCMTFRACLHVPCGTRQNQRAENKGQLKERLRPLQGVSVLVHTKAADLELDELAHRREMVGTKETVQNKPCTFAHLIRVAESWGKSVFPTEGSVVT